VDTFDTSPDTLDLAALAEPNMSPVLGRYMDRSWSHGVGHRLYDTSGRAYLDFANGIAVTALGHTHPRVTRRSTPGRPADRARPRDRLRGVHGHPGSDARGTLPEPLDSVLFLNSGSETIDGAIKLARRSPAARDHRLPGAFHGRTIGATSVTSSSLNYRVGYEPLLPGVYHVPYPAAYRDFAGDEAQRPRPAWATSGSCCATWWPPRRWRDPDRAGAGRGRLLPGAGGLPPGPAGAVRRARHPARRDEVQCGLGRTGEMWGFQHAGIVPDVVCVAKAIANGLPLSAIVTRRELGERWGRGAHGTTYGGNPVACAAGVAGLQTLRDEDLVANARARGV